MAIADEKRVLVTGGAGYIGSHMVLKLLRAGRAVTVLDDLSTGHAAAITRLRRAHPSARLEFVEGSVLDSAMLTRVLREGAIDAVLHFAGRALVGESIERPIDYWRVNAGGTTSLLAAMHESGARYLVFSSTCATYGVPPPASIPISEACAQSPCNPYGASKLACERAILDAASARGSALRPAILRYFNVIGCDPDGLLGEDHSPETHVIPSCLMVAAGARSEFILLGGDYATPDGTCIRDYVNVSDLCEAHLMTLDALEATAPTAPLAPLIFNVGTGVGHSVREVVEACERVVGRSIPQRTSARRGGDPPMLVADASRISRTLNWHARTPGLDASIAQLWRWMRANPAGYAERACANAGRQAR